MEWMKEIQTKWNAAVAHTFLLSGNVWDTVDGVNGLTDCLMQLPLIKERDIVIKYSLSAGITFPYPPHKQLFVKAFGLPDEDEENMEEFMPTETNSCLSAIEKMLRMTQDKETVSPKTALVIEYAEMLLPDAELSSMAQADRKTLNTILRWAKELSAIGAPIILIAENLSEVHSLLKTTSSRIETIQVPLPTVEKRQQYIEALIKQYEDSTEIVLSAPVIAKMTGGLRLLHIEDIFLKCEGSVLNEEAVKERKKELVDIEFGKIIEIYQPEKSFADIGGLSHVKNFLQKNVITPIKGGNKKRVPMGILFPGPPGTGKTFITECLAKETGLSCAALNLSKINDKWVGSSERNLEKALDCITALSPVLVIIDEIDQIGLSRENAGDSGVSNRLFKRLLEFMSNPKIRGEIVFVGLTNRPDNMDPALKRAGRFDKKIPILAPDKEERREILRVLFGKYGIKESLSPKDYQTISDQTDRYTGADLEALVLKASEVAEDNGKEVKIKSMAHALWAYRPALKDNERMTALALKECNDLDLLPPEYREEIRKEIEPQKTRKRRG